MVHKTKGGYRFGDKVYHTKRAAVRAMRAAYAHGYKGEHHHMKGNLQLPKIICTNCNKEVKIN